MSKRVFFYGLCTDIKFILSQTSIGVLSSESEGLPLALLEYGLAKIPVLVTDVGQCKVVVKNTEALVEAKNSAKFAKKITNIVLNSNLKNKIMVDLNKTIIENYSREYTIKKLKKVYTKLC